MFVHELGFMYKLKSGVDGMYQIKNYAVVLLFCLRPVNLIHDPNTAPSLRLKQNALSLSFLVFVMRYEGEHFVIFEFEPFSGFISGLSFQWMNFDVFLVFGWIWITE